MSRSLKNNFVLGAVAAAALVAAPANAAVTIGNSGSNTSLTTSGGSGGSAALDFNGFTGSPSGVIAALTAKLTLTFVNIVGNTFNFAYTLDNTSSSPVTASRVSGFGFDVDPGLTGASVVGTFNTAASGNVPNQIGPVDFCAKDGGGTNNCAGGGNGGVTLGNTGSGTFALTFASGTTAIGLDNFFVRYQSINAPGIEGGSASGQVTTPSSPVPEPAAWMLMILGFAGIGFAMRKQRHTTTARVRFV